MKTIGMIAWILLIIGGLNWGLVGLVHVNLVDMIFGMDSFLSRGIYILVGLSALFSGWKLFSCCKDSSCKM